MWFQDEMRLGQKNPRTRRWARRGTRSRAMADLRTQSAYVFGAICPELGTGAAVVMPRADTEAMQHQLDEIGRCAAPASHAIVVLDQAGWHTTDKLRLPENVSLLELPPKLNPAEKVWQFPPPDQTLQSHLRRLRRHCDRRLRGMEQPHRRS